jgi:hypothetical protein
MYKTIFKLETELSFLYQLQNTLDYTTRNGEVNDYKIHGQADFTSIIFMKIINN